MFLDIGIEELILKTRQLKCYIYTRVSTSIQVDGYSLDAQKDKLHKYADYQDMIIAGEYSDEGKSGKSVEGRPQFQQMLSDIESGKDNVDCVLVFKLSRFGRNAADVLSSLQRMQDFGVNLICVEDGIDSSKDAGKLMISVLSAVAEIERENILVQTMEGHRQKAREGKWNGGFAPYGYQLINGELSYENQVNYYTNYISENPLYEYAATYADEGISGTNTKKRDEFNRMIADCRAGKIDMIITKSISRFARNTLDCLNYVRELKDLGIGIIFEKENINTLDAKVEVLLTILSSLAQDESRSISENCTWGIRRRFEIGKHKMSTKRFLGYDADENGKLVINRLQEPIVVRLYQEFLDGKTTDYIKRIFEKEGIKNWNRGTKWQATTLMSMLENEKYKGDALLQKSYTVDFLTKKRAPNKGEIQMFYVEDDHDAIISKRIWECVQLEIKRRKKYLEEHGTNSYSHRPESNPFASKIICGDCNKVFARKGGGAARELTARYGSAVSGTR